MSYLDAYYRLSHEERVALNAKSHVFTKYRRVRRLYDDDYYPPYFDYGLMQRLKERRERIIARLEEEYPDFRKVYDKHCK